MKIQNKSRRRTLGIVEAQFVYRLFYPQVPVIICSRVGRRVASMPASSCMSVSDHPAAIALAVRRKTRTAQIIKSAGKFSLNWLNFRIPKTKEHILDLAGPTISPGLDKLEVNNISYSIERGVPVLNEAEAIAVCRNLKTLICGDHELFIAKILSAKASGDFLSKKYWQFESYRPVLYLGSLKKNPLTTFLY